MLQTLIPLFIVVVLAAMYILSDGKNSDAYLSWIIFLIFLVYPGISMTILLVAFHWRQLPNGDEWLWVDYSVQASKAGALCGSECGTIPNFVLGDGLSFTVYYRYAIFCTVFFVVGMPLAFLSVLAYHKEELFLKRGKVNEVGYLCELNPKMEKRYGILYSHYEPQFWW